MPIRRSCRPWQWQEGGRECYFGKMLYVLSPAKDGDVGEQPYKGHGLDELRSRQGWGAQWLKPEQYP